MERGSDRNLLCLYLVKKAWESHKKGVFLTHEFLLEYLGRDRVHKVIADGLLGSALRKHFAYVEVRRMKGCFVIIAGLEKIFWSQGLSVSQVPSSDEINIYLGIRV